MEAFVIEREESGSEEILVTAEVMSDNDLDAAQLMPKGKGNVSTRARQLYAQEGMRTKSRVIAALLAFSLGMFGVHKFYLGYNQVGFIMMAVSIIGGLITFGLVALVVWMIAIIEGIFYLTKSQADFERTYVVNQRDWL